MGGEVSLSSSPNLVPSAPSPPPAPRPVAQGPSQLLYSRPNLVTSSAALPWTPPLCNMDSCSC